MDRISSREVRVRYRQQVDRMAPLGRGRCCSYRWQLPWHNCGHGPLGNLQGASLSGISWLPRISRLSRVSRLPWFRWIQPLASRRGGCRDPEVEDLCRANDVTLAITQLLASA